MTLHVHSDIHAAASARPPPPPSLNFPLFCFIGIAPNSSLNRFTTPPSSSADPLLPTFCINQLKCTSKFVLRPLPSRPLRAAATHQPRRQRRWRRRQPKLHLALGSPCAAPLHPRRRDLYPFFAQRPFMAALHRRPQRSFAAGRGEIPERRALRDAAEKKELKRRQIRSHHSKLSSNVPPYDRPPSLKP